MWDLAILEKPGMGHSLSPIGTLGLLGGFAGICLGASFSLRGPMGCCTGTVCKNDKMQLTGKPENQKYWIYFLLLNTNPQHFGEMVAFLKNASQDPVSTNGGKPGSNWAMSRKSDPLFGVI